MVCSRASRSRTRYVYSRRTEGSPPYLGTPCFPSVDTSSLEGSTKFCHRRASSADMARTGKWQRYEVGFPKGLPQNQPKVNLESMLRCQCKTDSPKATGHPKANQSFCTLLLLCCMLEPCKAWRDGLKYIWDHVTCMMVCLTSMANQS